MKLYTDKSQTAKLIELGFEKPKSISSIKVTGDIITTAEDLIGEPSSVMGGKITANYSIGELLSFLPPIIPQGSGYYINITHDSVSWVIDYKQHGDTQYKYIVSDVELIDAAFAMIVKLKEKGVI